MTERTNIREFAATGTPSSSTYLRGDGTWATPPGGAGAAAQSYVGTNSAGATWTTLVSQRSYLKKVTLGAAGLLTSIEAHIRSDGTGQVDSWAVELHADRSGSPGELLAANMLRATSFLPVGAAGATIVPRWFGMSVGAWLTAGDYWIGVSVMNDTQIGLQIANTTGGSDRITNEGGAWLSDGGFYTVTTTTTNHSIRANVITL